MPNRNMPTRQDTFLVELWVEDDPGGSTNGSSPPGNYFDVWDKKTGGDADSDELKYYPGGMAPPRSLGGKINPTNLTLTRNYDANGDDYYLASLLHGVGRYRCTVSQSVLDFDGNLWGQAGVVTWTGILKKVTMPEVDSAGNAASVFEIEISCDGVPSRAKPTNSTVAPTLSSTGTVDSHF